MVDREEPLRSEGNVILCEDNLEEFKSLVAWITREPEFEITKKNMFGLAKLANKYGIQHLHHQLQTFTQSLILGNPTFTISLWAFAVRNEFSELEQYCEKKADLEKEVRKILSGEDGNGLAHLVCDQGVPLAVMSRLVKEILTNSSIKPDQNVLEAIRAAQL